MPRNKAVKDDIEHFPLSIFQASLNTVAGAVLVLFVATELGALFGCYALAGALPDYWLSLLLLNVAPIFLAVCHGWGLLYLAVLAFIGFKLIYEEAPRLRYFNLIAVMHFLCTLWMADAVNDFSDDERFRMRLLLTALAFGALLMFLFLTVFIWRWRRYRPLPTPAKTDAATDADLNSAETDPTTKTERE